MVSVANKCIAFLLSLLQVTIVDCAQLDPGEDGLKMLDDGDPFPPWPEDADNMPNDKYANRMGASDQIRSFGNECFQEGNYSRVRVRLFA